MTLRSGSERPSATPSLHSPGVPTECPAMEAGRRSACPLPHIALVVPHPSTRGYMSLQSPKPGEANGCRFDLSGWEGALWNASGTPKHLVNPAHQLGAQRAKLHCLDVLPNLGGRLEAGNGNGTFTARPQPA